MTTVEPATTDTRPYDALGPPTDPIGFPKPKIARGSRMRVLCYNESTGAEELVENVLLRNNGMDDIDASVQFAYWPVPFKEKVKTIMGHVEFCKVLEKLPREIKNDDDSSMEADDEEDGIVFRWTDRRVAVKVNYVERMDKLRNRHAEDPLQEIAAMQLLGDNPMNILGADEVLFDGQNLNVVMRFCRNGDLFQLLQDAQNRPDPVPGVPGLSEGEARHWFRQIMNGVQFLHSHGICHRDLSPENVMIDEHESLIIDMGMCLRIPYPSKNGHVCIEEAPVGVNRCLVKPQGPTGKLPYMSPEIFTSKGPFDGHAIDVWTCGTILFCMLTGNRSYQRPHLTDPQFYWMTKGLRQLLKDWNANLSEEGIKLMEGMLKVDPRQRLTMAEILAHPWFDGPDEAPMSIDR